MATLLAIWQHARDATTAAHMTITENDERWQGLRQQVRIQPAQDFSRALSGDGADLSEEKLKRDDLQAWDHAKVAEVGCEDRVAKRKGGGPDEEIGKGNIDSQDSLFPSEATRQLSNLGGIWLDRGELNQALKEDLAKLQAKGITLTAQSKQKLRIADGREDNRLVPNTLLDTRDELSGSLPCALR